jgi:hypothetical protein
VGRREEEGDHGSLAASGVAENTSRISTDEEEDDASTHFSSEKGLLAMRFLASGSSKNLELADGAEERE